MAQIALAPFRHPFGQGWHRTLVLRKATQEAVSIRSLVVVFALVAGAAVAGAAWYAFVVGGAVGDALARTYGALVATHSAYPRLSAVGLVRPLLPSLLQLPLVSLPGFASSSFSGGVVSALCAGGVAVVLNLLLARAGVVRGPRGFAIALFFTNPFIAFYAVNGTGEMPFLFFFVLAVYTYLRWSDTHDPRWLILGGGTCALMFLTRYDALVFGVVFAAAVALTMIRTALRPNPSEVEAHIFLLTTPLFYVAGLWMLFNWQLQGDPLYFSNSEYSASHLARFEAMTNPEIAALQASLPAFLGYGLRVALLLAPLAVLAGGAILVRVVRRRDAVACSLVALVVTVPLFGAINYRNGQSFGGWNLYLTLVPTGIILLCELMRRHLSPRWGQIAVAALLIGQIVGSLTSTYAMLGGISKPEAGCGAVADTQREFLLALADPTTWRDGCHDERAMAAYIVEQTHGREVITDGSGSQVVLFSGRPELFVLVGDPDYAPLALAAPAQVRYLLTADATPRDYRALDAYFPGLNKPAPPRLVLLHTAGTLRLYRVAAGG